MHSSAISPSAATLILVLVIADGAFGFARLCPYGWRHNSPNAGGGGPLDCKYGWEIDACGHKVCTKGPGALCGGKHRRYGICGEGLICSNCNRCQGCSSRTFECFDHAACIWRDHGRR